MMELKDWIPLLLAVLTVAVGWGGMRQIVKGMQEQLKEFQKTVIMVATIKQQVRTLQREMRLQRRATHDLRNLYLNRCFQDKEKEIAS